MPPQAVRAVVEAQGRSTPRVRGFPAVAEVYYCMALSLFAEAAYGDDFAVVSQGLALFSGAVEPDLVGKESISRLRSHIGAAPLPEPARRCCCLPLADVRH